LDEMRPIEEIDAMDDAVSIPKHSMLGQQRKAEWCVISGSRLFTA